MCWKTFKKEHAVVNTADRDIPVLKVVKNMGGEYMSWYRNSIYKEGKTYHTYMDIPWQLFEGLGCWWKANSGFHSYDVQTTYIGIKEYCDGDHSVSLQYLGYPVDELFLYDYNGMNRAYRMGCVIPEGSCYIMNEHGEYVSDTLRVISITPII